MQQPVSNCPRNGCQSLQVVPIHPLTCSAPKSVVCNVKATTASIEPWGHRCRTTEARLWSRRAGLFDCGPWQNLPKNSSFGVAFTGTARRWAPVQVDTGLSLRRPEPGPRARVRYPVEFKVLRVLPATVTSGSAGDRDWQVVERAPGLGGPGPRPGT